MKEKSIYDEIYNSYLSRNRKEWENSYEYNLENNIELALDDDIDLCKDILKQLNDTLYLSNKKYFIAGFKVALELLKD